MKTLALLAAFVAISPLSALASPATRYTAPCYLEPGSGITYQDECVVIETRTGKGFLNTRNIFSNRFGLTVKGRFREGVGYVTWDSHNDYEYKWEYEVGRIPGTSYVMPRFSVEGLPWD